MSTSSPLCLKRLPVLLDDLWKYSKSRTTWQLLETPSWVAKPSKREGHVMATVGADLYLHGGHVLGLSHLPSDELWRYSTISASWELLNKQEGGVQPSARSFHVMAAVGSELYLHGGLLNLKLWAAKVNAFVLQSSDELWKCSVERASWEPIKSPQGASKPSARQKHAMEVVGAELYLNGGFDWQTIPAGE